MRIGKWYIFHKKTFVKARIWTSYLSNALPSRPKKRVPAAQATLGPMPRQHCKTKMRKKTKRKRKRLGWCHSSAPGLCDDGRISTWPRLLVENEWDELCSGEAAVAAKLIFVCLIGAPLERMGVWLQDVKEESSCIGWTCLFMLCCLSVSTVHQLFFFHRADVQGFCWRDIPHW